MYFSEGAGFACQSRLIGVQPGPRAPSRRAACGPASLPLGRPGLANPPPRRRGRPDLRPARALLLARTPERLGQHVRRQERASIARQRIAARQRVPGLLVPGLLALGVLVLAGLLPGRMVPGPATVRRRVMRTQLHEELTVAPLIAAPLNVGLRLAARGRRPARRRVQLNAVLRLAAHGRRPARRRVQLNAVLLSRPAVGVECIAALRQRGTATAVGSSGLGQPQPADRQLDRLTGRRGVRPALRPPGRQLPRLTAVLRLRVHRWIVSDRPVRPRAQALGASSALPSRNGRRHAVGQVPTNAPHPHVRLPHVTDRRRPIAAPGRTRRALRTERGRRSSPAREPGWSAACAVPPRSIH